jgi:5-methylcytosine-specific restriction endonuclease McrA
VTPKAKRRAEQMRIYNEKTRPFIFQRANGLCQECTAQGTDPHHIFGRSGERLNDTRYIILLCHTCHERAGQDLKASRVRHLEILKGE